MDSGFQDGHLEDHKEALQEVVSLLHMSKSESKAMAAVGHRVVHGGESMSAPELITPCIKEAIERVIPLAPLHNPANLQVSCGIWDCGYPCHWITISYHMIKVSLCKKAFPLSPLFEIFFFRKGESELFYFFYKHSLSTSLRLSSDGTQHKFVNAKSRNFP